MDDGNGRIARAVGDLLLARAEGSPQRFYSLSAQIQRDIQSLISLGVLCKAPGGGRSTAYELAE